jgi:hypothetical protein
MDISYGQICGAEQKEKSYCRKVIQDFHEGWQLAPFKIHISQPSFNSKEMGVHPT